MNRLDRRWNGRHKGQPIRDKRAKAAPHPLAMPRDENGRAIRLGPIAAEAMRWLR